MEKQTNETMHELDYALGDININRSTLNDARSLLGRLRDDMDNAKTEELIYQFKEFHEKVRLLDDLLGYTVKDLNTNYEKAESIKDKFFNQKDNEVK